jgi:hypothetical protein
MAEPAIIADVYVGKVVVVVASLSEALQVFTNFSLDAVSQFVPS